MALVSGVRELEGSLLPPLFIDRLFPNFPSGFLSRSLSSRDAKIENFFFKIPEEIAKNTPVPFSHEVKKVQMLKF